MSCNRTIALVHTLACTLIVLSAIAAGAQSAPDFVLRGTVTGKQKNTYIESPFTVPVGTYRVTLVLAFTDKERRTTLDLGIIDSHGTRCWSGGNKTTLTMSSTDATPSCLVGPIDAGTWKLLLGVPSIRRDVTSTYTAEVYFAKTGRVDAEPSFLRKPIRSGPAWYRGDLHMHTGYSDGSCKSLAGVIVPCPLFLTADAAVRRGLDFIAITDHNTTSHYAPMREIAPYFDTLLLIPGREITTFYGHANIFGSEDYLDFRLGSPSVSDSNTMFRRALALGALISLNHPGSPTGEACMGCGWNPEPATDLGLISAIEAVNGSSGEGTFSGIPFWQRGLSSGYRLTAVGGSDSHNALKPLDQIGSIGSPTTVVYAADLSTASILAAIRAGHVFIDLTASKDRLLEFTARATSQTASMGDELSVPAGASVGFTAHVTGAQGATLILLEDGEPLAGRQPDNIGTADQSVPFQWKSDGRRHWFRINVRGPDGKLWLLGNPIYLNWPASSAL